MPSNALTLANTFELDEWERGRSGLSWLGVRPAGKAREGLGLGILFSELSEKTKYVPSKFSGGGSFAVARLTMENSAPKALNACPTALCANGL